MRKLLLGLLIVAGCGEAKSGKTVVRFLDGAAGRDGWHDVIAKFEAAHPDIDIERVEGPQDTNKREEMYATEFLSGGSTYDIVNMDIAWLPKFASKGWLLALDDRFKDQDQFLPGDIEASKFDGKIYRVPTQADGGLLYYRTDIVGKPPETFDELVELAQKHQKPEELWGFVFQGKQYEGLVCVFLEILWGHGGDVMNFDSPATVRAFKWLQGLVGRISPPGVTTYEEEQARTLFQQGKAVFMRNWPYAWNLLNQDGSPVKGKVGIAPMPHAPGRKSASTMGGWGLGIAKDSKNADAAWKFIQFVTQPEQQKVLYFKNGVIPTRKALFEDADILKASPHYKQLYQVLLNARPRPVHPKYSQISDVLQSYASAVLIGKQTPEEAAKQAAEKIRKVVEK